MTNTQCPLLVLFFFVGEIAGFYVVNITAYSILDMHEIVNTSPVQSIATTIAGNVPSLWADETAVYTGTAGGSCSPAVGDWCWVVETAGSDATDVWGHDPDLGNCSASYSNPESFDYSCTPGGGKDRCADGSAYGS